MPNSPFQSEKRYAPCSLISQKGVKPEKGGTLYYVLVHALRKSNAQIQR